MSKQETIMILAMLGAFYSGGRNDPKMQADAWHLILQKYDFEIAKTAVLKFVENDTRENAWFPAVGNIVGSIKKEEAERMKPIKEIKMAISHGKHYEDIHPQCKSLISREMYDEWLKMDAEQFENEASTFMEMLKVKNRNRLTV